MAHFAKISENNEVLQVLTCDNSVATTEEKGQEWLETHNSWPAHLWIQTSYNTQNNQHKNGGTPFRGNYAGIGHTWDSTNEIFWPPQPYASWVKDIPSASWKSPVGDEPALTEEQISQNTARTHTWGYNWNEETQAWDLMDSGPVSV
jgi:hypothetical protein|tara:strand:- start:337 stop:777 length:441 start_codon:yes stop_codon:yes gene_type:complete